MSCAPTEFPSDHIPSVHAEHAAPAGDAPGEPSGPSGDPGAGGDAPKRRRRRRRRGGGGPRPEGATGVNHASHDSTGPEGSAEDGAPVSSGEPGGEHGSERTPRAEGEGPRRRRRRRGGRGRGGPNGPNGPSGPGEPGADRAPRQRSDDHEPDRHERGEPGPDHEDAPERAAPAPVRRRERAAVSTKASADIFDEEGGFERLGLNENILKGIRGEGFDKPTKIQAALIPAALTGRDLLGQAKTGTGKTAAFGLPLLQMVKPGVGTQALILAPTRELAIQISKEIEALGRHTGIKVAPIYGGQAIHAQTKKLERLPEIIVGTPGRVMDMVERRLLNFANVRFAVLDEVDRMLDIGFRDDIRRILKSCPERRQTIFVSATISPDIESLARSFMHDPEKIVTAAGSLTVSLVEQHYLPVNPWDKKRLLHHLLTHEEPALTVVFCRLKRTVDDLAEFLQKKGIDAHAIHGDMRQGKRNAVMEKLRGGSLEVLIASDLASRGIDVDGITHVINYDLPDDVELYVHRIGRTARAGRGGVAWAFVTPEQGGHLTDIEKLINAEIPRLDYPDFVPSDRPAGFRDRNGSPFTPGPPRPAPVNRIAAAAAPPPPPPEVRVDASKFPGGLVPTVVPPKRMQGRIKSQRR